MDILIIALIIVQTLIIIALLKNISGKSNGKNDEKLESIAQDIASTKEELRNPASDISNLKMETQNSGSRLRKEVQNNIIPSAIFFPKTKKDIPNCRIPA